MKKDKASTGHNIIVIGASLGGIEALSALLNQIPATIPAAILVVIHLHPSSPAYADRILSKHTKLKVKFAVDNEKLEQGTVYLAPPNQHLLIEDAHTALSFGARENRSRPAIDPLFRSAAVTHPGQVIGVILSGMLDDGSAGLRAIQECGGLAVVQEPSDAEYAEMPQNAARESGTEYVVPLAGMGKLLAELVEKPSKAPVEVPPHLRLEVKAACGIARLPEEPIGEPIFVVCPECGGSMTEIRTRGSMNYRCHEGHAYSESSLTSAQEEKTESALWTAARVLDEQASMLKRLAIREIASSLSRQHYESRIKEIRQQAQQIRDFLLHRSPETVQP